MQFINLYFLEKNLKQAKKIVKYLIIKIRKAKLVLNKEICLINWQLIKNAIK